MNEWSEFKYKIKEPLAKGRAKVAMTRLHVILKAILLRRTKFQKLDNKPIIQLTARNVHILKLGFTDPCVRLLFLSVELLTMSTETNGRCTRRSVPRSKFR